jgi:hypothetical protein
LSSASLSCQRETVPLNSCNGCEVCGRYEFIPQLGVPDNHLDCLAYLVMEPLASLSPRGVGLEL